MVSEILSGFHSNVFERDIFLEKKTQAECKNAFSNAWDLRGLNKQLSL